MHAASATSLLLLTIKGGELSYMALAKPYGTRDNCIQIATDAIRADPGRPSADASSLGTRLHRHSLHCYSMPADQSSNHLLYCMQ